MTTIHNPLDRYSSEAQNSQITPQQKINDLKEIIKSSQTAMFTTRTANGELHSRAMNPLSPDRDTELTLTFLANNASHKFEEIQNDSHVNVSFLNPSTTSWASFSGKARVTQDRNLIERHWSSVSSAWFGDMKDGAHKGDASDPRVAIIQVIPDEIRYWYSTKGKLGRAIDIGVGAVSGETATPGELRTITKDEIQLTQGLHTTA